MPTDLPSQARHVLIADNDANVSSLLVEVLARRGFRTVCAYDGDVAYELAQDPNVQVLVCDLDMPRRTGLEVLESLPAALTPPTIVVSGYLDGEIEARLGALRCVRAILRKPFDLFGFADLVARLAPRGEPTERAIGTEL